MYNNCTIDQISSFENGVIRRSTSKSLFNDITKYLNTSSPNSSKHNVELGLEIEINESVQRVLKDEESTDDLLAVTIIRPSDSKMVHETTVALNKDDVKEFIALVENHRTKHQLTDINDKKIEKETKKTKKHRDRDKSVNKRAKTYRESLKKGISKDSINVPHTGSKRRSISSKYTGDSKEILPSPHSSKYSKLHLSTFENSKQVYTTINTFDKLKEVLPCQNSNRSDKPGVPCICPNCGIMDVLVQSQKGPVVEFPPLDEVRQSDRDRKDKHKRESSRRDGKHANPSSGLDIDILKEINARINNLEKRLAVQEETAVSKDYLKHVLHKIFAQYKNE